MINQKIEVSPVSSCHNNFDKEASIYCLPLSAKIRARTNLNRSIHCFLVLPSTSFATEVHRPSTLAFEAKNKKERYMQINTE